MLRGNMLCSLSVGRVRRASGTHHATREVAAIVARDFFPGESRKQMEGALAEAEMRSMLAFRRMSPAQRNANSPPGRKKNYRDRTWATREHLWVDRVACGADPPVIDPSAKFLWLENRRFTTTWLHQGHDIEAVLLHEMQELQGRAGRRFWPISHFWTVETLVFSRAANTAWLTWTGR